MFTCGFFEETFLFARVAESTCQVHRRGLAPLAAASSGIDLFTLVQIFTPLPAAVLVFVSLRLSSPFPLCPIAANAPSCQGATTQSWHVMRDYHHSPWWQVCYDARTILEPSAPVWNDSTAQSVISSKKRLPFWCGVFEKREGDTRPCHRRSIIGFNNFSLPDLLLTWALQCAPVSMVPKRRMWCGIARFTCCFIPWKWNHPISPLC